ncbi:sugar porter (SP) family MFS transporter [Dysgonomonas hofstadii]|uniref:Sugar porter (SP) family MFS transporter n=1 Tax=Dysgonomonas hofstadii TaxID=637886 RepID=A0A840CRM6_9BACT|nr:sugar porter family MFS transporter [Dysgonomonas hofstadii]MBB4034403.1 sugar porter (SP) family MFS transporter [Dysgonomonas hofstadii]
MKNSKYLYWITFVAINGGLMFGLNMASISGATEMLQSDFSLSNSGLGMVTGSMMLGCLIGALFTGSLAERFGRKKIMIFAAISFIISALGCALSNSLAMLTAFRILTGITVGSISVVGPMYISEVAPAKKRGTLVSFNQLAITIGILLAYFLDYLLVDLGDQSWRYMLGIPAVFAVLFLIFLIISFPESPRWLLKQGKKELSLTIFEKIEGGIPEELSELKISNNNTTSISIKDLFRGKTGKIVFIGTLIAVFQQITGINAVLIFAPDILKSAGVGGETALQQSMLVGLVNFLMTIVAIRLVDKKGRKTLLLSGAIGMTIALSFLTYQFTQPDRNSTLVLIALLLYIAFFAASFAPVMWVIISEIYPADIKGLAMSFSTAVSWVFTFITVYTAPLIRSNWGDYALFAIYALFSVLAFIFVKRYIPETKGKTLEQIQEELKL